MVAGFSTVMFVLFSDLTICVVIYLQMW